MSHEAAARRYAKAVFEIGQETGTAAALGRELASFAEAFSSSAELRAALSNPLVPDTAQVAILQDLGARLALSPVATNVLRVLAKNRRLAALPDLARHLGRLVDEATSVVRAQVTSAAPLSDAYLARLKGELERATGKRVEIATAVDPSLLGGVVTRIGDRILDGSIRSRLHQFRDGILQTSGGTAPAA